MPIQLNEKADGKIIVVRVTGQLVEEDYETFVPEIDRLIEKHGKLRVLFDMLEFRGWTASALWEDIKFDVTHYDKIERLAMVGDKKWEKGMATFCKPFTKAKVKYFDHREAAAAEAWLAEA